MRSLFALLIYMLPLSVMAQPNITYSSASFPEPDWWNRILLLKNGNTVYINGDESTLHIRVYDKDRKPVNSQDVPYRKAVEGGIPKDLSWKDIYEVNGNVILWITAKTGCGMGGQINCIQSLYRLVIDPTTAKIVKGDKLAETEKVRSWGYNLDTVTVNDIYTVKDPVSDMYAVLVFNGYTEDMPDRVKLMTYNGNNELVKTAVLNAPSTQDKAVHLAGLCMYNKTVYLGSNIRNKKEKGLNVPLCISMLKESADGFETKTLNITPFAINSDNKLEYNPGTQMLEMLTTTEVSKKNTGGFFANGSESTHYYSSGITMLDPATLEVKHAGHVDGSLADKYAKQKLGEKDGFNGVMPFFYSNGNNATTVIQQELRSERRSAGRTFVSVNLVDKLGFIRMGSDGKASDAYVMRIREVNTNNYAASGTFYDYQYLSTPAAGYMIMNDLEENFDKPESAKPHSIGSISDASTILYKMADGKIEKSYLWGAPIKKRDNKFAMVGTSTYDAESRTWATIVVDAADKKARLAWVTFN